MISCRSAPWCWGSRPVPGTVDGGEAQGASFGHSVDESKPVFVAARIGCTLFVVVEIAGPVIEEVGGNRDGTTYAETDAIVVVVAVAVAVAAGVEDRRRRERRATLHRGSRGPRLGWSWLRWRWRSLRWTLWWLRNRIATYFDQLTDGRGCPHGIVVVIVAKGGNRCGPAAWAGCGLEQNRR